MHEIQHIETGLFHGNSNHFKENQHNTSSGSPNLKRRNARANPALGDAEEGLEKQDKVQK
ncbi:hypothetical protein E2C01_065585 [Portunus trituberculatus]|uniref:Uncharacterized protein n=1 Tax=Portunus trituberculatus TaxID=210409 RepID=A0A5B7HEZ7_PORTR|nr:hypothetical protein [Portunus trituberculatus]